MPGKKHGPGIKNPDAYEEIRKDGASKEKAARISNAMAPRRQQGRPPRRQGR